MRSRPVAGRRQPALPPSAPQPDPGSFVPLAFARRPCPGRTLHRRARCRATLDGASGHDSRRSLPRVATLARRTRHAKQFFSRWQRSTSARAIPPRSWRRAATSQPGRERQRRHRLGLPRSELQHRDPARRQQPGQRRRAPPDTRPARPRPPSSAARGSCAPPRASGRRYRRPRYREGWQRTRSNLPAQRRRPVGRHEHGARPASPCAPRIARRQRRRRRRRGRPRRPSAAGNSASAASSRRRCRCRDRGRAAPAPRSGNSRQRRLDQRLACRPRDQRGRRDLQIQGPELLPPDQ